MLWSKAGKPAGFGSIISDRETLDAASIPKKISHCVTLDGKSPPADQIIKALLLASDTRSVMIDGTLQHRRIPFQHIILRASNALSGEEVRLARQLMLRCGDTVERFHVSIITSDLLADEKAYCYFGQGVFSPSGDAIQVADLEFALSEPIRGAQVQTFTPKLKGLSGRNADQPAAWYQGQSGLAFSLDQSLTPAVLPRDIFTESLQQKLAGKILFFGRLSGSERPTFRAFRAAGSVAQAEDGFNFSIHCPTVNDWFRRDGEWQFIDIGGEKLWFCYKNRTGFANFNASLKRVVQRGIKALETQQVSGVPILSVEGLILPGTGGLPPFIRGGVRSWQVMFDADGLFRHSEAGGAAYSVINRSGNRLGVFDHQNQRYAGDEREIMSLPLHGDRRINLMYFDPLRLRTQRPKEEYAALSAIYPGNALLLKVSGGGNSDFVSYGGFIPPPERMLELVSRPDRPIGIFSSADNEAGHLLPVLSLDWVNRGARVERNGVWTGLADYWLANWRYRLLVASHAVHVEVEKGDHKGRNSQILNYQITQGNVGVIGPLLIRYHWYTGQDDSS